MELENKYVGSKFNGLCEYFCELTEFLDNIADEKRLSRRHYILGKPYNFESKVLPIRRTGSTVGRVFIDKNNVITKVLMDGIYHNDIYPKDIHKMLERYVGKKIFIKYD